MRLTNNSTDIPSYLKSIPRWIIWELTSNGQKIPKRPTCEMLTNGSSTDPTCWSDFNTAARAMLHHSDSHNIGLGFVLVGDDPSDSPVVGFDLDDSLKSDGEIKPWAAKIMESLEPIAYTEVSPSGTGLKCFVAGDLPEGFVSKKSFGDGKEGTEVYGSGRYFAVTGDKLYADNLATVAPESILRAVEACVDKRAAKVAEFVRIDHSVVTDSDRITSYLTNCGGVGEGGRNNKLYNVAGHLAVNFKLSEQDVMKYAGSYNTMNCSPPLSYHELSLTVRSAMKTCHERLEDTTKEDEHPVRFEGDSPSIDLEKMAENQNKRNKQSVKGKTLRAPGLIEEIMHNYNQVSASWLPELAFASALNVLSVAMAGKVKMKDTGSVPCTFSIGLAPSGSGKDFGRKLSEEILIAAGMQEKLGPEMISSAEGFVKVMQDQPTVLFQIDEAAEMFGEMANQNSHMKKLGAVMKIAYSKAGSKMWKPNARADKANNVVVENPHPVIFCMTTAERFWPSFDAASVGDGLLGRLLVFEQDGYDKRLRRIYRQPDPTDSIIGQVAKWRGEGNLPETVARVKPMEWPMTENAREMYLDYCDEIVVKRNSGNIDDALFSRTPDKICIMALLFAGSRLGPDKNGTVNADDMRRAIEIVKRLTYRVLDRVKTSVSHNEVEKSRKYVISQLSKQTGDRIEVGKISTITQRLRSPERREILKDLLDSRLIEIVENKAGKQFYSII